MLCPKCKTELVFVEKVENGERFLCPNCERTFLMRKKVQDIVLNENGEVEEALDDSQSSKKIAKDNTAVGIITNDVTKDDNKKAKSNNKKKSIIIGSVSGFVAVLAIVAIVVCYSFGLLTGTFSKKMVNRIDIGDAPNQVVSLLGEPDEKTDKGMISSFYTGDYVWYNFSSSKAQAKYEQVVELSSSSSVVDQTIATNLLVEIYNEPIDFIDISFNSAKVQNVTLIKNVTIKNVLEEQIPKKEISDVKINNNVVPKNTKSFLVYTVTCADGSFEKGEIMVEKELVQTSGGHEISWVSSFGQCSATITAE